MCHPGRKNRGLNTTTTVRRATYGRAVVGCWGRYFRLKHPGDYDVQIEQLIQPEIRLAEARYMPFVAKNLLQSTGNWGAVRVIPRATDAVDLTLDGRILESDGERLVIEARVTDATGDSGLLNNILDWQASTPIQIR